MADADVLVRIAAKLDELQSGLNQATNMVRDASQGMSEGFKNASNESSSFGSKLESALNLGLFLELKEVATQAFEAIRGAMEATVGKAEEFGLSSAKMAAQMNMSITEAAALRASLDDVGASGEEYTSMVMRMTMRLKSSEADWRTYGMATRDANGNLLQGKELMDSAIATMQQYKSGTDQNAFALAVFGRSAAQIYDIMRVNNEVIDENKKMMNDLGVDTTPRAAAAAAEFQMKLSELKDYFEFSAIALGQKLMPIAEAFINWVMTDGQPILKGFGVVIEVLAGTVVVLGVGFIQTGQLIGGAVAEIINVLGHLAIVMYDLVTFKWDKLGSDFKAAMDDIKYTFNKTVEDMKKTAENGAAIFSLYGKKPDEGGAPAKSPYDTGGGTRHFTDAKISTGLADEAAAAEKARLEAQIKMEQDAANFQMQMGQIAADKLAQIEEALADRKLSIQQAYLQRKAALDANDPVKHKKDLDDIAAAEQNHALQIQQIHERLALAKQKIRDEDFQNSMKDLDFERQRREADIQSQATMGAITTEQKIAQEKQLTVEIENEQIERIKAMMVGLDQQSAAYRRYQQQIVQITQQASLQIQNLNNQAVQQYVQRWTQAMSTILGGFKSALSGMLAGTTSWRQALLQVVNSITNAFLDMGAKILEDWLRTQVAKLAISQTTEAADKATVVGANASKAASGAYSALAGIPYIGPIIAPIGAAVAYAGTMAFAEKGALLDEDAPVYAHKKEMILPASLSQGVQALVASGGGGKGDVNLHYGPTVNGGSKTLEEMLRDESRTMQNWMMARVRDGSLKAPKGY